MTQEAIKRAVKAGYHADMEFFMVNLPEYARCQILLDPKFWQALGEYEGWGKDVGNGNAWMKKMHQFIDHIIYGGSYDEFFKKILR